MLRRLLTAAILIPLVVWAILGLPTPAFAVATGVFIALAAWEWTGLIPLRARAAKLIYLGVFGVLAGATWWWLQRHPGWLAGLLVPVMIWWLLAACWLRWPSLGSGWVAFKVPLALLAVLPAWLVLSALHGRSGPTSGPELTLFIFALMWIADSGAYFSGKTLGRHKLAPRVSPGKTWEGVAGGLVGGGLFALLGGLWFGWSGNRLLGFVVLAGVCVAVSIVGDLFISLLKRQQGLKDTGRLFPGHGGVLDRIDSLLAAAPVFVYGFTWVE
ncbi:MAG: phosphatidate cytidylyltransferase [Gammaproteobacteria bacterium]